jgi:hypothetical protein
MANIVKIPTSEWDAASGDGTILGAEIPVPGDGTPVTIVVTASGATPQRCLACRDSNVFNDVLLDCRGQGMQIGSITSALSTSPIYVISAHATRPEENQANAWTANPMSITASTDTSVTVSGVDADSGGVTVSVSW